MWDKISQTLVAEEILYKVTYDPLLETDVQWVFIQSLDVKDGILLAVTEEGKKYWLDLTPFLKSQPAFKEGGP